MGLFDAFIDGVVGKELTSDSPLVSTKDLGGISALGPSGVGGGILGAMESLGGGSAGFSRGSKQLLASYLHSPHIRKVVNLIANQIAAVPIYLVKQKSRNKGKAYKAINSANGASEIVNDHAFLDFLYDGCMLLDETSARHLAVVYFLLVGESFRMIWPFEDNRGKSSFRWVVLPPHWVKEVPGFDRSYYKVQMGAKTMNVPEELMLWVRDPNVLDPFSRGAGIGDSLRDELDTDEYASRLLRTTMANKGLVDGILSPSGGGLSDDASRRLLRQWEEHTRGGRSAGRVRLLPAEVKFTQMTHAFSELKLLELRAAEKAVIEETFAVPPELFGKTDNANRATSFIAYRNFAKITMIPLLTQECAAMTAQWLPHFDPKGEFYVWFEDPSPDDLELRRELIGVSPEAFSVNEIRETGGLHRVDWGEVRYVTGNKLEIPAVSSGGAQKKSLMAGGILVTEADEPFRY
jgi:hypothetical protein